MKTTGPALASSPSPYHAANRDRQDADNDAFTALIDGKLANGRASDQERCQPDGGWQRLATKLEPFVTSPAARRSGKETTESPAETEVSGKALKHLDAEDGKAADPKTASGEEAESQSGKTTAQPQAPVVLAAMLATALPAAAAASALPRKGEPTPPQSPDRNTREVVAPKAVADVDTAATPDIARPESLAATEPRPWSVRPEPADATSARPLREPPAPAAKLTVVSAQNIPAPSTPPLAPPAAALVEGPASPQGSSAARGPHTLPEKGAQPAHSLQIQLKPAELGVVTAQLRLSGEALSVDIQVETAEAYHRLSSDREAIVSALRAIGHDIDMITIRPPAATATDPQHGAGQNLNRQPGQSQGNHDGQNSPTRHGNQQGEDGQGAAPQPPAPAFSAADRAMYI